MTSRFGTPMLFVLLLALTSLACSKDLADVLQGRMKRTLEVVHVLCGDSQSIKYLD